MKIIMRHVVHNCPTGKYDAEVWGLTVKTDCGLVSTSDNEYHEWISDMKSSEYSIHTTCKNCLRRKR